MAIPTKWKFTLGAVIVVLVCCIEDSKCCSGGDKEIRRNTFKGSICGQVLPFYLLRKNLIINIAIWATIIILRFTLFKCHGTDKGEADGAPIDILDFVGGDAFNETDDGIDHVMEAIEKGKESDFDWYLNQNDLRIRIYEGDMVLNEHQFKEKEPYSETFQAIFKETRLWQKFDEIERRGCRYRAGEELNFNMPNKNPNIKPQKICVVGGGPVGLRMAIELQMGGHQVKLFNFVIIN